MPVSEAQDLAGGGPLSCSLSERYFKMMSCNYKSQPFWMN